MEKIQSIPKKIWGIGSVVFGLLTIIAYGFSSYLDKIEVGDISNWYHTIINICPQIIKLADFKGKWVFIVATGVFILLFLTSLIYRKRLFLIRHQTMAYDLAKIDKSVKHKYWIKEHILQQTGQIHSDNIENNVIKEIDTLALEAQKSKKQIAYYGIAHTPLIFRLGFKIGDQNNVVLLHKKRNNASLFEEWKNEKSGIKVISREENKKKNSKELIVAISTSFEIKKEHLRLLHPESKHMLFLVTNYLDFDSILSYDDAEALRADILFNIREINKKYKIEKVHMVISSSVAFTFFLAQGYSAQHDPEIVVYHYEHENYSWGIEINKKPENAFVKL